jgi:hypothetical protein
MGIITPIVAGMTGLRASPFHSSRDFFQIE